MTDTNIKLSDLDDESISLVKKFALKCCEAGEAPILLFGRGLKSSEFSFLMDSLIKTGGDLVSHPAFDKPEHFTALLIIQSEIRDNYLKIMSDPNLNLNIIENRSPLLAPLIIQEGDDSGLVSVKGMRPTQMWFEHEGKALYILPAKTGSLNSSWPLSGLFCNTIKDDSLKIRPDAFRICPIEKASMRFEFSRGYGKPFNKAWLHSLKGVEVAQHYPDPTNPLIGGDLTQFIWERLDNDEIQFSCEELPESLKDTVTTRFLHGIFDLKTNSFTHFDGAIHIYTAESYLLRQSLHLSAHYMNYKKAKVFRLDSSLTFDKAELLLSSFYRWNELVPEYFSHHGKDSKALNKP